MTSQGCGKLHILDDHGNDVCISDVLIMPLKSKKMLEFVIPENENGLINPIKWKNKGYLIASAGAFYLEYRNPSGGSLWIFYDHLGNYYLLLNQSKLNFTKLVGELPKRTFTSSQITELKDVEAKSEKLVRIRATRTKKSSLDPTALSLREQKQFRDLFELHTSYQHPGRRRLKDILTKTRNLHFPNKLYELLHVVCPYCLVAKTIKSDYHHLPKSDSPLHYVYGDVLTIPTKYVTTPDSCTVIRDVFSGYTFLGIHRAQFGKADAQLAVKWFVNHIERQTHGREPQYVVKNFITDGGKEFDNNELKSYCNEKGIVHTLATPFEPQQNGPAERVNRTILQNIRINLLQSGVPDRYWPWAAAHAVNVMNHSYSSELGMSPHECVTGTPPNDRFIIPFGCFAIYYDRPPIGGKPGTQPKNDMTSKYADGSLLGAKKTTTKTKTEPAGEYGITLGGSPRYLGLAILKLDDSRQIYHTRNAKVFVRLFPLSDPEAYAKVMTAMTGINLPFKWTKKTTDSSIRWNMMEESPKFAETAKEEFDSARVTASQLPDDPSHYPPPNTPLDQVEPNIEIINSIDPTDYGIPTPTQTESELVDTDYEHDEVNEIDEVEKADVPPAKPSPPKKVHFADTLDTDANLSSEESKPTTEEPHNTSPDNSKEVLPYTPFNPADMLTKPPSTGKNDQLSKIPKKLQMDLVGAENEIDLTQGRETRSTSKKRRRSAKDGELISEIYDTKHTKKRGRVNLIRLIRHIRELNRGFAFKDNRPMPISDPIERLAVDHHVRILRAAVKSKSNKKSLTYWQAIELELPRAAVLRELEAHLNLLTWYQEVICTNNPEILNRVIPTKWLIESKTKLDELGKYIEVWKARLVARGDLQSLLTFCETYAPTMSLEILRFIFAFAVEHDFVLWQVDINTAYLNALLPEDEYIYIIPPLGTGIDFHADKPGFFNVFRLHRALYGLKQSGYLWYHELNNYLIQELGFKEAKQFKSVYVYAQHDEVVLILGVFVDDILICGKTIAEVEWIKSMLSIYGIKDLGVPSEILKTRIHVNPDKTITMDRTQTIDKLAAEYNIVANNYVTTPMLEGFNIDWLEEHEQLTFMTPTQIRGLEQEARSKIGVASYLCLCCRPDISYAVNTLSRLVACPTPKVMKAINRLLQYLVNTKDKKLVFKRDTRTSKNFVGFFDASFQKEESDEHLTKRSGLSYMIYNHGPIHWKSTRSKWVCTSTAHAEATALATTIEEVVFLNKVKHFLTYGKELDDDAITSDDLYTDSWTVVNQIRNGGQLTNSKTRSFQVKIAYAFETVRERQMNLVHVNAEQNPPDAGTKALGPREFIAKAESLLDFSLVDTTPSLRFQEAYLK
ncbi:hypothetical protein DIURU_001197 [Diutina rugosa]|uniref:Integrase catalytic domain-containing protein n=1 Tax=Diutina rugosa TaxID=5481 RepID=A0A642UX26_DIURU|nr:uncharacterized protein DIURU_001197 [Diutina rugosa]KAA8906142.1 hypothetical protein DIURU_001197 [Diutina rugosa]